MPSDAHFILRSAGAERKKQRKKQRNKQTKRIYMEKKTN
jgi:hypothetical protein